MRPQGCDRRIITLVCSGKFIHRREDGVENVVSTLFGALGRCSSEALYSPLFSGRIDCFNNSVSVGEDQVPRNELNSSDLIVGIRKHSDGRATGFKPTDRVVSPNDHRRIVAGIHVTQRASRSIEDAVE